MFRERVAREGGKPERPEWAAQSRLLELVRWASSVRDVANVPFEVHIHFASPGVAFRMTLCELAATTRFPGRVVFLPDALISQ